LDKPRVIAVDFDGTLCKADFPNIGEAKREVILALMSEKERGSKIVLWTCRHGKHLLDAIVWCAQQGLEFDSVNENLPEIIALYGDDTRKISADEYWDDKAIHID